MTIGQKIIISSTLVAILAALAAFMGWKNTQPIQKEMVKTLTHTTEEIWFLGDVKTKMTGIQSEILELADKITDDEIKDLNLYSETCRSIDTRIKALKTQIEAFAQFNANPETADNIERMLSLCKSLRDKTRTLFPYNNLLPELTIVSKAEEGARQVVEDFMAILETDRQQRFSFIEKEGRLVEAQISKLNFWIILIGGLTFLMAIISGRVIARNLSTKIEQLHEAAAKINKGDYSARAGLSSSDEFGKLGQTFDGIAANLQQSKIIEEQTAEMQRLNEELKTKNDSLDSFVYRVSHDLKAPVVNIKSLLKLIRLKMSNIEHSDVAQSFFFLEKSTDKLHQTIFDLLEVSRIEQSLQTTKEWVNLERILSNIRSENSEFISACDVKISTDFKIPDIYFSSANLDSILSNLINNGIKYSSPLRQPVIHVSSEQRGDWVCLCIKDNGLGIDLDKYENKLFGMFNRFHNHVEGSGVGLYIVKKIVEQSGGRIEVKSQIEEGTTFNIFLQQEDVPATTEARAAL